MKEYERLNKQLVKISYIGREIMIEERQNAEKLDAKDLQYGMLTIEDSIDSFMY